MVIYKSRTLFINGIILQVITQHTFTYGAEVKSPPLST